MTVSKSGIGYSVGGKGARVTKRARDGIQATLHVPGTGVSYTTGSVSIPNRSNSQLADAASKKTRRRDKVTAKSQPVDQIPIDAQAMARMDKPRRSRRGVRSNTVSPEGRSTMQQPTPPERGIPRADKPVQQPRAARTDPGDEPASARAHRNFWVAGHWYYVVIIATAG